MGIFLDRIPTPDELKAKSAEPQSSPRPVSYEVVTAFVFKMLEVQLSRKKLPITIAVAAEKLAPHLGRFAIETAVSGWVLVISFDPKLNKFKLQFDEPRENSADGAQLECDTPSVLNTDIEQIEWEDGDDIPANPVTETQNQSDLINSDLNVQSGPVDVRWIETY